jgi:ferric-dicitrate binding protein FerR (iron transport regulator)
LAYSTAENNSPEIKYNILITPKGGQYMVILPDGTKAWLNASSSLKYPLAFNSDDRVVELTGEGYFEVAKDQNKHFKVKLKNDAVVEVTGTHFNIMAYDDEINIQTTLIEGSVLVNSNNKQIKILPGQQAAIQKDGTIELNTRVNTEDVIAWQNGLFKYKDQPIENIMRQVARWYDVDIVYEGKVTDHFNVTGISRNVSVSKLFNLLELTGRVHFSVEDKKIIVKP